MAAALRFAFDVLHTSCVLVLADCPSALSASHTPTQFSISSRITSSRSRRRVILSFPSMAAASRLEVIDGVLQRIFMPLGLVDRLRLSLVSRRWRQLLLSELRVPCRLRHHIESILRFAQSSLLRLDVSDFPRSDITELVNKHLALFPAQLVEFVAFSSAQECAGSDFLSSIAVRRLHAACPLLEAGSRLFFHAVEVDVALELLDSVPGRHAVALPSPGASGQASFRALLRHPRLSGLHLYKAEGHTSIAEDRAACDAVLEALGTTSGCSLELLWVEECTAAAPLTELTDEAAAAALASAVRKGHAAAFSRLTTLCFDAYVDPAFVFGVAARLSGGLRVLDLGPKMRHRGAAAALIAPSAASLETVHICNEEHSVEATAAISRLLAAPECRLRTLGLAFGPLEAFYAEGNDGGDLGLLLSAIAGNETLASLTLTPTDLEEEGFVLLAAALAKRAAPLVELSVDRCQVGAAGAHLSPPSSANSCCVDGTVAALLRMHPSSGLVCCGCNIQSLNRADSFPPCCAVALLQSPPRRRRCPCCERAPLDLRPLQ